MNSKIKNLSIYSISLTLPILVSGILILVGHQEIQASLLLLILCVLLIAIKLGQSPAISTAITSLLCFNFFFTDPKFTLFMDHTEDIIAALTFFSVAIIIGHQTQKIKKQAHDEFEMKKSLQNTIIEKDREVLRTALMSSLSHDLKTPLVTMIGATSSLIELKESLTESDKDALLDSVLSEAKRLERYIQNLLDMTRLGYGGLAIDRQIITISEVLQALKKRVVKDYTNANLVIKCPDTLPEIEIHPALVEQALYNLTENAIKFSPTGDEVIITCHTEPNWLVIDIIDKGPGIPEELRDNAFDLFNTLGRGDKHQAGEGLGLAIAKGMIGAHGGKLLILKPLNFESGTCMRVMLPISE
ncbi:MAG: ATP-binding protein [Nitrincola lacisaponensis]|uniref:sensor histidine kinase n=1 Tax=Nitrincola lacisaponensis TaxID=267850 RepID=UPI00391ABFC4